MGGDIPIITSRKLIKILKKQGLYIHHQKGSHAVLKHMNNSAIRITIPVHNKDLKKKTLLSILSQAGITIADFKKLV